MVSECISFWHHSKDNSHESEDIIRWGPSVMPNFILFSKSKLPMDNPSLFHFWGHLLLLETQELCTSLVVQGLRIHLPMQGTWV